MRFRVVRSRCVGVAVRRIGTLVLRALKLASVGELRQTVQFNAKCIVLSSLLGLAGGTRGSNAVMSTLPTIASFEFRKPKIPAGTLFLRNTAVYLLVEAGLTTLKLALFPSDQVRLLGTIESSSG